MKQTINGTLFIIILFSFSCKKADNFTTDISAKLNFSTDTVTFDTIFTTIGSTTLKLKFYNRNKEAVKTTIALAGGSNSPYKLNIDGDTKQAVNNYEIAPNDSAYIFVEVTIDPQNSNSPMVIADSIMFNTNGNEQNIKLIAYGQDVHLFNSATIGNSVWTSDKPYLIYNSIEIQENSTLTIKEGAQIHFHNASNMWIKGNLIVEGSIKNKVTFQGDRLEEEYAYYPSQWYGIEYINGKAYEFGGLFFFPSSKNNIIDNAVIKNGAIGIQLVDTTPSEELKLTLSNSQIFNMSAYGLTAQHCNTMVYNTTIGNCKLNAVGLFLSGNHQFFHSTIANYYNHDKPQQPALFMGNYYKEENFSFNAIFGNCIIAGNYDYELQTAFNADNNCEISLLFDHCMVKLPPELNTSNPNIFNNIISYDNPFFIDSVHGNYRIDSMSAIVNSGSIEIGNLIPYDKDGNSRLIDGKPDLGAYEFIENDAN